MIGLRVADIKNIPGSTSKMPSSVYYVVRKLTICRDCKRWPKVSILKFKKLRSKKRTPILKLAPTHRPLLKLFHRAKSLRMPVVASKLLMLPITNLVLGSKSLITNHLINSQLCHSISSADLKLRVKSFLFLIIMGILSGKRSQFGIKIKSKGNWRKKRKRRTSKLYMMLKNILLRLVLGITN